MAMTRCVTPNWSQNSFTKAIQGSSLANLTAGLNVAVDSQFTSRKLNCSTSRPTSFIFIPSLLWPIVGSYAGHCHWLAVGTVGATALAAAAALERPSGHDEVVTS